MHLARVMRNKNLVGFPPTRKYYDFYLLEFGTYNYQTSKVPIPMGYPRVLLNY